MMGVLFWLCVLLVAYVYAGYPLLLTILASVRPKPKTRQRISPSITLLIAAYNEEHVIARKIENSLSLKYPKEKLQILVAADGSDDKTPEIVRSYASQGVQLSYIPPRSGKSAAISRAMSEAKGEIIAFSDANNFYPEEYLEEIIQPFADPKIGAVSGAKQIVQSDDGLSASEGTYWKYESFIKEQETRLGCCTSVAGEVLAVRKHLFEPIPKEIINDDFYIAMRIIRSGNNIAYAPKARSFEHVSQSAQDERTRRTRIVAGRYQAMAMPGKFLPKGRLLVVWQIISHKFMRPLVPLAMIGAFFANLIAVILPNQSQSLGILWLAPPVNWILFSLQLIFYFLAFVGGRRDKTNRIGKFLYLFSYLVNSNLAALNGLVRFLRGSETSIWKRVSRKENESQIEAEIMRNSQKDAE